MGIAHPPGLAHPGLTELAAVRSGRRVRLSPAAGASSSGGEDARQVAVDAGRTAAL
jgi:hypothetical protein